MLVSKKLLQALPLTAAVCVASTLAVTPMQVVVNLVPKIHFNGLVPKVYWVCPPKTTAGFYGTSSLLDGHLTCCYGMCGTGIGSPVFYTATDPTYEYKYAFEYPDHFGRIKFAYSCVAADGKNCFMPTITKI